ncbi:BLUF domain-containing protein [Ideonella paludis]|uniref:BLUF domain-containing protein n=1 Tax=Ideonella paludis TaxID=1233411 RepID=A0ABS5E188_9BURK|nr:BLUF domain-containing protein [Ideonella paludis]MBQ0937143.1 BLUF domain-containing protein [Ideonella paludis]
MLERLVYRSTASREMDPRPLFDLLTQAQERNARLGITGHLLYLRGQFTQCVEGPTDSLDALWQSLLRDPRHHSIELLVRRPAEARRFPEWSMAFSTDSTMFVHGLKGFFPVDGSGNSPLVGLCSV